MKFLPKILFGIFLVLIIFSPGCTKFISVPPPTTQLVDEAVFNSDATAISAVLGIYSGMMQNPSMASLQTTLLTGLTADELTDYSTNPDQRSFYFNAILPTSALNAGLWNNCYQSIYSANAILEGLSSSGAVSLSIKNQLTAEVKFIRAFNYFYLINLYGDVPLIVSTDYLVNRSAARESQEKVYKLILADLKDARSGLPADYLDDFGNTTIERVRPNRWAALALLARTDLYLGDYQEAIDFASQIIAHTELYQMPADLNEVFLKNSVESIWQLQVVSPYFNTFEGNTFILTAPPGGYAGVSLSPEVFAAFEPGDLRHSNWIGSFTDGTNTWNYPYKYKVAAGGDVTEYSMVLRLAEQYLIRAEARARQNDLTGAAADLNVIRNRAGLPDTDAKDQLTLLKAILHERQVELFTEWGHRWFDLKRTGNIDNVLSAEKNGWQSTDSLFPIPLPELNTDPSLIQNPGY